ncbi:hypothetical protein VNO80_19035 [Phaseolus coccineus]|uniref:Uncharacterized protein n=1 Tax=Phaseolus coccineus TaxID=3886 RepID=A0AAN9QWZ0_PHACN
MKETVQVDQLGRWWWLCTHPTQPKPAPCGVTVAASSIEFTQNSSDTGPTSSFSSVLATYSTASLSYRDAIIVCLLPVPFGSG